MKIIIKELNGRDCVVEVGPTTTMLEIKSQIAVTLNIPIEKQKLLHLGRSLVNEKTILSYSGIKDGTKLNLVVKKPKGFFEELLRYFKDIGTSDAEAIGRAKKFSTVLHDNINDLSWDEIDRLCAEIMFLEAEHNRPTAYAQNYTGRIGL